MSATKDANRANAQQLVDATAQLAEAVGGRALVFAVAEAGAFRLRSAAGFPNPESARDASLALTESIREAMAGDEVVELAAVPGLDAPGGVFVRSLRHGPTPHGAVVVSVREVLSPEQWTRMSALCDQIAGQLAPTPAAFAIQPDPAKDDAEGVAEDADGDEVLRLSEALFAQDIELLRSKEKLGTIERLKDDFIEKMSRELRTPLNHIIEAIISVLTGEDDALSEAAKTALRTALDEGSAFQRTLQNILDLWRIKQGELPVEVQDVNFRELVDEAIFSVHDSIGDRPVRIETQIEEPFPRLRTDLTKLNQILFMLLDNAVKFSNEGTVRIIGSATEDLLRVEIVDEGVGICHDDLENIFDEFYQVDESESQQYRGAGLGLTLVRDLVALLDGDLHVESDIGRGTKATVTLPVQTV